MTQTDAHSAPTVLFCRSVVGGADRADGAAADVATEYDDIPADLVPPSWRPLAHACRGLRSHVVGARPTKAIDPLLTGRVLVVGDDADLNAVVLRLLRKNLLPVVEIAYAPAAPTPVAALRGLAPGVDAVAAARAGVVRPAPLVRSDAGGVLVGRAELTAMTTPFYVDARRVPAGRPALVSVHPDDVAGLVVTVVRPGPLKIGRRTQTYSGRAVEFGIAAGNGTTVTFDGLRHPREVNRWVFYRHTEPLLLVR